MSKWVPIGPDCVFAPRNPNYLRLSRRGEFGRQGLVIGIAVDPTDAGTIYTAEAPASGGNSAFRTDDNGTTWLPIVDDLQQSDPSGVNPRCIAVHPLSTGYVYMGTLSGRIYVSPNSKGDTWNPSFFNIGSSVIKIVVDPRSASNPSTTIVYAACGNGVWRSSDGAASFSQILSGSLSDFTARFPSDGTPADFYAGIISTGVFYATDPTSTASWTNLTASATSNLPPNSQFDRMLIDTCRPTRRPYVWFINTVKGSEATTSLYTASDPAESWTAISMTSPPQPKYWVIYGVLYDFTFAIAANSPGDGSNDILLFGSVHLYRSLNSGTTWYDTSTGSDEYHDDYHAFVFFPDPPPPGVIPATYIGSDGGLGVSTRLTDPTATFPPTDSDDDNMLQYTNSAVVQNYSHGKQSSAIYQYNSDPRIGALGYIGCQDTGVNAGDSALLWRGIFNADGGSIAVTQGVDGVKVWNRIGEAFFMYLATDQGQFDPPIVNVTLPGGRVVDGTSNFIVDPNGNCLAGISAYPPTTSSAAAITTGTHTITPGSMTYIELGSILSLDDGTANNAESVTVTSVTGSTFTANFAISHNAGVGITRLSDTSIAAAIPVGQQTVQPGSMENIFVGLNLTIDSGTLQETVTVTAVTSNTFTASFGNAHGKGAAVTIPLQALARVDQSGNASILSQNFSTVSVGIVAVSPTSANIVFMATSDQRLYSSPNATASTPSWTEITTSKLAGLTMASIAVDWNNNTFVLLSNAISTGGGEFPSSTPLFWISGTTWVQIPCVNTPGTSGFGNLRADPVQPGTMYASNGARVYKLTTDGPPGSSVTWVDISNGLPGQWIYDLWVGNVGNATTPKVLLRAAVPTRGMWETDVTAGASDKALVLYMRDNFLDMGRLPSPPDGVPNPYDPSNPGATVYHYQCADIKVDAQQQGSGVANFFQTDPEDGTLPISHVTFDQLKDNSEHLPSADQSMVHVQVRNRGLSTANNVSVWVVYANAGAGLPALNLSSSSGNNFQFWSQFIVTGQVLPNLPNDSPWKSVGPPQVLKGITTSNPQVASWKWAVPTLGSGDPGHYCLAALVHCSGSPINQTGYDVDTITPANKQIGQKNLHVGPPLPSGGSGEGGGGGGGGGGVPGSGLPMREYIEFHNSTNSTRTSTLVIDLRGLPPQLAVSFSLTELNTVQPLPVSITGVVSTTGEPGSIGGCDKHHHHHHHHHEGCDDDCHDSDHCTCPGKANPKHNCEECSKFFSQFTPIIYTASPSSKVEISGVLNPAYGSVAAYFTVTNTGTLPEGKQYRFNIQQFVDGKVIGGSTYVVRIAGGIPFHPFSTEEPEGTGKGDEGEVLDALPVWIQERALAARKALALN